MTQLKVTDQGDPKYYWTQIPNIVCCLGLSPFELSLYLHLKRTVGNENGKCTKSRTTLAKETGMSTGSVSKARLGLEQKRPELGDKALITVTEIPNPKGGKPSLEIQIADIWPDNMARFARSPHDVANVTESLEQRHGECLTTSPDDVKKNSTKEEQKQEEPKPPFRGQEFQDTWKDFESHRVELKHPLTAAGRKKIYAKLVGHDESVAVEMLNDAIAHGWRSVFEPKGNQNGTGTRSQFETSSERNIRNLRETGAYIRQLQGETSDEYPESTPPLLIGSFQR